MSKVKCKIRCEHGAWCGRKAGHSRLHIGYCPVNGGFSVWNDEGECVGE